MATFLLWWHSRIIVIETICGSFLLLHCCSTVHPTDHSDTVYNSTELQMPCCHCTMAFQFFTPMHVHCEKKKSKLTSKAKWRVEFFWFWIKWQGIGFIIQWHCICAERMQHMSLIYYTNPSSWYPQLAGEQQPEKDKKFKMEWLIAHQNFCTKINENEVAIKVISKWLIC